MNAFKVTNEFNSFLKQENMFNEKDTIDAVLTEFREIRGGLIPVLQQVQNIVKYLPTPVQDYIALGLGVPSSDVYGVVSFYSFFSMKPRGRNIIKVCLGTACYVKGAERIIDKIERGLDVKMTMTTDDRRFTLLGVRCLGACGLAPVVMVNEDTLGLVEAGKIIKLLDKYE